MSLRQQLIALAEEIEQEHTYSVLSGRCSCGRLKSRQPQIIRDHYLGAVAAYMDGNGLTLAPHDTP
jgi:hypothetical protein